MKKYIITSEIWSGEVEICYNDSGVLSTMDFSRACVSESQQIAMLHRIPVMVADLINFTHGTLASIREIRFEPTFADFWKQYFTGRSKDNSSKKKSETRWNRMTAKQRLEAYNYIGRYMQNIPTGTMPKLGETYLNSEVWEN